MELNGLAVTALIVGLILFFDIAALRWGVDSRRLDVRSDLIRH